MKKNTKVTIVTTLGAVALGATIFGAVPALAADNAGGRGGSLQNGLCQAASTVCSTVANTGDSTACTGFVDTDGDGICDTCGADNHPHNDCGTNYVDADGDGVCDNYGTARTGHGSCYVDANDDGICDNRGDGTGNGYESGACDGTGNHHGRNAGGNGGHHGSNHHASGHHGRR